MICDGWTQQEVERQIASWHPDTIPLALARCGNADKAARALFAMLTAYGECKYPRTDRGAYWSISNIRQAIRNRNNKEQ